MQSGVIVGEVVGSGQDARRTIQANGWELAAWEAEPEEPRVRDLDLAERLGFADPHMVRRLISRRQKDNGFGVIYTVTETSGAKGGRPARAFWLTEAQALEIAAASETTAAKKITREMIRVFMLARRGLLPQQQTEIMRQVRAEFDGLRGMLSTLQAENETLRGRLLQIEAKAERAIESGGRIGEKAARILNGRMWQIAQFRLPGAPRPTVRREKMSIERKLRNEYNFSAPGSSWHRLPNGEKYDLIDRRLDIMLREAMVAARAQLAIAQAGNQLALFSGKTRPS